MGRFKATVVATALAVALAGGPAVLAACEGLCSAAGNTAVAGSETALAAAATDGHAHHHGAEAEEQPAAVAAAQIAGVATPGCCSSYGPPLPFFTAARPDGARADQADAAVLASMAPHCPASPTAGLRRPPPGPSPALRTPSVLRI